MKMKCTWRKALVLMMTLVLSLSLTVQAEGIMQEPNGEIQDDNGAGNPEDAASGGQEVPGTIEPWVTISYLTGKGQGGGTRGEVLFEIRNLWEGAPDEFKEFEEVEGDSQIIGDITVTFWIVNSVDEGNEHFRDDQYLLKEEWEEFINAASAYTEGAYTGKNLHLQDSASEKDEERIQFREGVIKCYQDLMSKIKISTGSKRVVSADKITASSGTCQREDGSTVSVKLQVAPGTLQNIPGLDSTLKPSLDTIITSTTPGFQIAGIYDISVVDVQTGAAVNIDSSVDIVIPYPAGFGTGDEFKVFHYNSNLGQWEAVPIKGKEQDGILCSVNGFSPFAVASSKAAENTGNNPNPAPAGSPGSSSGSSGGGATPESTPLTNIPQTGDRFPAEWLFVLAAGAIVVIGVEVYAKRKKGY